MCDGLQSKSGGPQSACPSKPARRHSPPASTTRDPSASTIPAFTSPTKGDGEQIVKIMRKESALHGPGMPFYWRVNYELNAWNYGFEAAAEMSKLNLGSRISQGHAANLETYNAPSLTQPLVRGRDNRKAAMFNSIKMLSVPADYKVGTYYI